MKKTLTVIVCIAIIFMLAALVFDWGRRNDSVQNSNTVAATSSVSILVLYPVDNQEVTSPIHISGTVSGSWLSEGLFPIELVNSDGNVISTTSGAVSDSWASTSADVNFSATIFYPKATTTDRAFLLLSNENPSGNANGLQERFIPLILK